MRKGYTETMPKRSHDDEGKPIYGAPVSVLETSAEASDTARERVAAWMRGQGFATGKGDTLEELLSELVWQAREMSLHMMGE